MPWRHGRRAEQALKSHAKGRLLLVVETPMDKCCDMVRTIRFVMAARMAGLKTRAESAFIDGLLVFTSNVGALLR